MALFTASEPENPTRPRRTRRVGWSLAAVGVVGVAIVALVPAPYVLEQPGPVFDTLGTVEVKGQEVPLIDIPGEKTYPTDGTLDMLTVTIAGNPESLPSWAEIATAWFDPSKAVLPVNEVYPPGETLEQSNEQSNVDMINSQKQAIAAALIELGYTVPSTLSVVESSKGSPADGVLLPKDIIESVNGETFENVDELRAAVKKNGTDVAAQVVVSRNGTEKTIAITPTLSKGTDPVPVLGILIQNDYSFPVDVKIQLENVGGPSAGMMFALGIIDKLTPGELNGGEKVAGTGTITSTGEVGPIGGIRQKMYGAVRAGAKWFLAPADNCDEVVGHVPDGLRVFKVATLDDSLKALKAIDSGSGLTALATCSG